MLTTLLSELHRICPYSKKKLENCVKHQKLLTILLHNQYKHILTPISSGKYQVVMDNRTKPKYLAINPDATLYATLHNLDRCTPIRDTYICNDESILKKVGQTSSYLIDFFMNDLGREKLGYKYQVLPINSLLYR